MAERQHGRLVPTAIVKKNDEDAGRQRLLAALFMDGAYKGMYGGYMKDLANTYALDDGTKYPDSLEEAYQVLDLYSEKNATSGANTKKKKSKFRDEESHAQFNG
eukprot:scaffold1526_cov69-Cylindrotheca_fusiformis.AAC.1